MFVPLVFGDTKIVDNDRYNKYEALLRVDGHGFNKYKKFVDIVENLHIYEFAVREELFFKYKKQIQNAEKNKNYNKLLTIMLSDGVKIYVH